MDDADKWSLWQGDDTRLMQVHPPDVTQTLLKSTITKGRVTFITYGDEETLKAIQKLNNAQVRARQGE